MESIAPPKPEADLVSEPKKTSENKHLSIRFDQLKQETDFEREQVLQLVGPTEEELKGREVEPDQIISEIQSDALASKEGIDYLKATRGVVEDYDRGRTQVHDRNWKGYREKYAKLEELAAQHEVVKSKLKDIEGKHIINRVFLTKEKRDLVEKNRFLEQERNRLGGETFRDYDVRSKLDQDLQKNSIKIIDKRSTIVTDIIKETVQKIEARYTEFGNELKQNSDFRKEINSVYVREILATQVRDEVAKGFITQEYGASVLSKALDYVQKKGTADEEKAYEELSQTVKENDNTRFQEIVLSLSGQRDIAIIDALVGHIASQEVENLEHGVHGRIHGRYKNEPNNPGVLGGKIDKFFSSWRNNSTSNILNAKGEPQQILGKRRISLYSLENGAVDPRFWTALRLAPQAQEIFGDSLTKIDANIYQSIENIVVRNNGQGDTINLLRYYPTPESVSTLILLSTAEHQFSRTGLANNTLTYLSRREDWQEIVDKTIDKHQFLSSARQLLIEGKFPDFGINNELREKCSQFAATYLADPNVSSDKKNLAVQALGNNGLLYLASLKGYISENQAETIRQALSIGQEHIGYNSLESWLRNSCIGLLRTEYAEQSRNDAIRILDRLAKIGERVVENKANEELVKTLARYEVVNAFVNDMATLDILVAFVQTGSVFMKEDMGQLRKYILDNSDLLLKDTTDINFLVQIVGNFGKKADAIIEGYTECLRQSAVQNQDKQLVLEFIGKFRILSPTLISGYVEAKKGGYDKIYIAQLTSIAERMTGYGKITNEEKEKPYFEDLLKHVYPNHAGQWSDWERNKSCEDRSQDLSGFKIKPRYEIDLLSSSVIKLREGASLNAQALEPIKEQFFRISRSLQENDFAPDKMLKELDAELDEKVKVVLEKPEFLGTNAKDLKLREEKMFILLLDQAYGDGRQGVDSLKSLSLRYEFALFEDIREYISGTSDRVSRAGNQEYALLCELNNFFADRVKEINRRIVETSINNPKIKDDLMPKIFQNVSRSTQTEQRRIELNRLQIDKLGINDGFVKQIGRVLEARSGKKYTPEQVRRITHLYELTTGGLQEKSSQSGNKQTKAFYGQLKSQRDRTIQAIKVATGMQVNPKELHLGQVDFEKLIKAEEQVIDGKYDSEEFAAYTAQRFVDLFQNERMTIEEELAKFESESGKRREVIFGYISKTQETAHARMVGGVCVSGDNPGPHEKNMWQLPNYFQMVFQEPDTAQCQGLVLLHTVEDNGKKILSVSLNPSSTYLYSVDEGALFTGVMTSLEDFAKENGFDAIAISKNKQIRTNRTGGVFERALDERISEVGKNLTLSESQHFSYHPAYTLSDLDILWEAA